MPNFNALKEAIDTCKGPLVMVALTKGEVAAKRTELHAFTNGNGFFMVSNVGKLHSVLDGKLLSPVEKAMKQELAGEDFETLDDLVTMKSVPTDGTVVPELIGVDTDVAFALVGEDVFCPITGKPSKLEYHGEIAVDGEEGDDVLDVADDTKPNTDDTSDDSDDGSTMDDDSDDSSDDSSDDDSDDSSSDDDSSDDSDDSSSDSEEISDDDVDFDGEDDAGDDDSDDSDDDDDTGTDDGSDDDDIEKASAILKKLKARKAKKLAAAKLAKEVAAKAKAKSSKKKVKEVADNDTSDDYSVAGSDTQALLNKYNGSVNIYGTADATDPMLKGACVKALSADTFVVSDDEGDTYTVKSSGISDDGTAMKIVGDSKSTESATQEVYASENTDLDVAAVRIMSLTGADHSEVAVFVGPTHIGTLHRTRASEVAASLFDDGKRLYAAFRPTLASNFDNPKSPELAKFGYVPVTFKVEVAKLFEKRVAYEVSQVKKSAEVASATKLSDYSSNLELSFVGIAKGFFKGKPVELITEVASLLRRAGVQNAELEARRVVVKSAPSLIKVALEKAKELNGKSADYLTGITEGVANATFSGVEQASTADTVISTALLDTDHVAVRKPAPEIAGFETKQPTVNRFDRLVAGIRR